MNKLHLRGSLLLFSIVVLIFSCSDDLLKVGLDILPDSDILEANVDTIAIECYTYKGIPGKIVKSTSEKDSISIGHVFDPIFGETISEVPIEFFYDTENLYERPEGVISEEVVSLKLYLNTDKINSETGTMPAYGDPEVPFDIDMFLFNARYSYNQKTNINVPSDFFSSISSRAINTTHASLYAPTNSTNTIPTLSDSNYYTVIKLDQLLANQLADTNLYPNQTGFYEVLPGFLLRPRITSGDMGAIQQFRPNLSKLILEYKQTFKDISDGDSTTTKYASYDVENYQNYYRNNHTGRGAEIESAFRDTNNQVEKFYLQGLGGTRAMIKVNYLKDFRNRHLDSVGVNLAELVFPIDKESLKDTLQFRLPPRIWIQGPIASEPIILPDDRMGIAGYYNGFLDSKNHEYRVNITEYVNFIMLEKYGELEYFLLNMSVGEYSNISPTNPDHKIPSRVVLNSGLEDNIDKAFLRIIYTHI